MLTITNYIIIFKFNRQDGPIMRARNNFVSRLYPQPCPGRHCCVFRLSLDILKICFEFIKKALLSAIMGYWYRYQKNAR